jgi:hypothetical protein
MRRDVSRRAPRAAGSAATLAGFLLLGGCVAPYGERVDPVALEQERALSPEAAFVVPASGGPRVLGVIERTYRNAVRQKIVLQNDGSVSGENAIEVTFYGPLKATIDAGNLKRDTGTLHDIDIEMRRKIPLAMAISPNFAQNTLGPFGFALGGSTAAGRCIYAWQRIHAQRNVFLEPSARGEISLRLRFCRRGVSDDTLLGLMYGIAIVATLPNRNWNPYGMPTPPDPAIGARGEVIRPPLGQAAPSAASAGQLGTTPASAGPPPSSLGRRSPARTEAAPRPLVPPGQLPTPVAEPTLIRPSAPLTLSPPLQLPPTLGEVPVEATPSQPRVPPAPAASGTPAVPPVRNVTPLSPAVPPSPTAASPARVAPVGAPPVFPTAPGNASVPASPRVAP